MIYYPGKNKEMEMGRNKNKTEFMSKEIRAQEEKLIHFRPIQKITASFLSVLEEQTAESKNSHNNNNV